MKRVSGTQRLADGDGANTSSPSAFGQAKRLADASVPAGSGMRGNADVRRRRRAASRQKVVQQDGRGVENFLRYNSVSPSTQVFYRKEVDCFRQWCLANGAKHRFVKHCRTKAEIAKVDCSLSAYFASLFAEGYGAGRLRFTLHGYNLFHTDFDGNKSKPFPRANRVIKGSARCRPSQSKDPMPEFAVMTMAHEALFLFGWRVAMGIIVEFDTYLRSCNILAAQRSDISVPQTSAGSLYKGRYAIKVGTSSKPTKNYTHGHAVVIGDLRPWLPNVIATMMTKLEEGRLWPFCHSKWSQMLSMSAVSASLPFQVRPHILRHSAASCDAFAKLREPEDIRRRGFWASPKSVQIYERHAALLRSVEIMPPKLQLLCRQKEKELIQMLPSVVAECNPDVPVDPSRSKVRLIIDSRASLLNQA